MKLLKKLFLGLSTLVLTCASSMAIDLDWNADALDTDGTLTVYVYSGYGQPKSYNQMRVKVTVNDIEGFDSKTIHSDWVPRGNSTVKIFPFFIESMVPVSDIDVTVYSYDDEEYTLPNWSASYDTGKSYNYFRYVAGAGIWWDEGDSGDITIISDNDQ